MLSKYLNKTEKGRKWVVRKNRTTENAIIRRQIFRLIQSIPSPKAEPFKLWLAQLASERLDEMQDPEITIDRALEQYLKLGYSENWINQRLKSIEIRKELTEEWKNEDWKKVYSSLRWPTSLQKRGQAGRQKSVPV